MGYSVFSIGDDVGDTSVSGGFWDAWRCSRAPKSMRARWDIIPHCLC